MRTLVIQPGVCRSVFFTFKPVGSMRSVHLVCPKRVPPEPKGGDRAWLTSTPFLTVEVNGERADGTRVLFAMDETVDTSKVLSALDAENQTIAVSEDDVMLVSTGMRIPLVVITEDQKRWDGGEGGEGGEDLAAVFRVCPAAVKM
nr:hypothetical protein TetV2_00138 [Oceanusvirus sp.]